MCYIFQARKNLSLIIDDRQVEILSGCLLGDACILKRGAIQIEQGKKQRKYLLWKYSQLKPLISVKPIKLTRIRQNGKITHSYRIVKKQFFRMWREKIYRNSRKIVHNSLLNNFSSLSLAIWYMDDGCLRNNSQAVICTDSYSNKSLGKLRNFLKQKWDIETRIKFKREKGTDKIYRRLTIGSYHLVKFFNLIRPSIIPSMKYKITDPLTTQSIKRRHRV